MDATEMNARMLQDLRNQQKDMASALEKRKGKCVLRAVGWAIVFALTIYPAPVSWPRVLDYIVAAGFAVFALQALIDYAKEECWQKDRYHE